MEDRERCLKEFEDYYRAHYEVMTKQVGLGDSPDLFSGAALLKLYDDYCRDSAARLYDSIQLVVPRMAGRPRESAIRILDISLFATTQMFRILFPKAAVSACDKHLKWLPFLDGVDGRACNLELDALPYADGSFDLAIFTETLEHIPRSPYAILREVTRVLSPGGVLLFSVPNLSALNNRIKLLLGKDILSVELAHADSFGHFREYNMSEVQHLVRQVGMEVLYSEYVYYGAPHASAGGLGAAKAVITGLVSRPLMAVMPSLRPVCLVVARK